MTTRRDCLRGIAAMAGGLLASACALADARSDFFRAVATDRVQEVRDALMRGTDPNLSDDQGQSALVVALREGSLKVADLLIADTRTKVNTLNAKGESALMIAALKGELAQALALIEQRDAEVNKPGWAPLHYAASQDNVALIRLMLDHYAFIDATSPNGTTPLMMAAGYGSAEGVKLLLDEGADVTMKNYLGLTAADFARRAGRDEVAQTLQNALRATQPKGW